MRNYGDDHDSAAAYIAATAGGVAGDGTRGFGHLQLAVERDHARREDDRVAYTCGGAERRVRSVWRRECAGRAATEAGCVREPGPAALPRAEGQRCGAGKRGR